MTKARVRFVMLGVVAAMLAATTAASALSLRARLWVFGYSTGQIPFNCANNQGVYAQAIGWGDTGYPPIVCVANGSSGHGIWSAWNSSCTGGVNISAHLRSGDSTTGPTYCGAGLGGWVGSVYCDADMTVWRSGESCTSRTLRARAEGAP